MNKLKVYVAGPYTQGDQAKNVRYALVIGNCLLGKGFAPFIPHLTHFWHLCHLHPYQTWMDYDAEWLKVCDALFRCQGMSAGADTEVKLARVQKIPVFQSLAEISYWRSGLA